MNSPFKITPAVTACPDPALAFLARASARYRLVVAGKMTLDAAIDGLIEPFEDLFGARLCDCALDTVERWELRYPPVKRSVARMRTTPQTTIEAVLHSVRERGLPALKEPANVERLSRCDANARRQADFRIAKLTKDRQR